MSGPPGTVSSRRRIGRRPADQAGISTQESILSVAERVFADNGYASSTLREIAAQADVTQALIIYYFGNKQGLFEALFRRRGLQMARERQALLDALLARPVEATLRELVTAYLAPQFALRRQGPEGLAFVRLQARLYQESDELSLRLRREVYDGSTRNYIAAFVRLGGLSEADAHWRMTFAVGTYLPVLSGFDRLAEISEGRFGTDDTEEVVRRLTDFIVAGMAAGGSGEGRP